MAGRDAIREALSLAHPDEPCFELATRLKRRDGGDDPLDGFTVFLVDRPVAHWLYVSYGFSDLDQKETDDLILSGYGFELCFRLARESGEESPPIWPILLMQKIARYVFESGEALAAGDTFELGRPLAEGSRLRAFAFARDPELVPMDTAFGHVEFLAMIALTEDERVLAGAKGVSEIARAIAETDSLWIAREPKGPAPEHLR
jgi:suppressor of fused